MYLKIEEELYNKISDITVTDYEKVGDYIPAENIISMLQDLVSEIDSLNEKIEDIEQDKEDNYKPISKSDMYE